MGIEEIKERHRRAVKARRERGMSRQASKAAKLAEARQHKPLFRPMKFGTKVKIYRLHLSENSVVSSNFSIYDGSYTGYLDDAAKAIECYLSQGGSGYD